MQVNIKQDEIIDGYSTRYILDATIEEYNEISLALLSRLHDLENRLENYKYFKDRFKNSIEETGEKINLLKNIIQILA